MRYLNKTTALPLVALLVASLAGCGKQVVKPTTKAPTSNINASSMVMPPSAAGVPPPSLESASARTPVIMICPDPSKVLENKGQSLWQDQGLSWSTGVTNWGIGDKLEFMEAFVAKAGGNLNCYYRWPNPNINQPGTWLWMSIQLNPSATEVAVPYGQHWVVNIKPTGLLCTSRLPKTCAFTLQVIDASAESEGTASVNVGS